MYHYASPYSVGVFFRRPDFHECAVSCAVFSFDILRCENVTYYSGNAGGPVALIRMLWLRG
jgi:hypothetical protein